MKAPSSRRIVTVAVTVLILLVLVVAGTRVQVPFVALGPGPTVNTLGTIDDNGREVPVVEITGTQVDKTDGHLNLTTVGVSDGLSLFQAIGMWMSGTYSVQPRETVYPPGQTTEQTRQQNLDQMSNSESTATAAALRFLQRPTALVAAYVEPSGPAGKVLKTGDVIVSVDGKAVTTAEDVRTTIAKLHPDQQIPVAIVREGTAQTVTVTTGTRPGTTDVAYLGVTPEVRSADPNVQIDYHVGDIGGPSAGLMLSLSVVDQLSTGSLTRGKFIAGTGTISDTGEVGPIGGVTHKTRAARDNGATVFLVPADNCAEADSDAPDGLQLVKVTSLQSAVDALDAIGEGRDAPHC
ncbi:PDZ domain-containing protein [Gordonia desulfuricans]|uniref:endopeptidase La n=1 Tax=Gordonia desulfuricans TaxID=89051 RepID=A0A7K3LMN3_9ACTN|nr:MULTISPECIES: PDZ domain-containing protein [Gordonia]EMP11965.2 signal protein PDZ [Gordonia sp. NB41Y]NDK89514.1 PDZ domain-containing protein [Gordonia desulfuricans]WLP89884.1 PDZ domain-containing protein [Gordonia sp. NB41Y]